MRLENKVVFISGAGGGMGRVAATMFAQEGAKIVVNDYRADAVEETVQMVHDAGGEAVGAPGDVSVAADVQRAIHAGEETFGLVNVLYNNAGIMPDGDESVLDMETDVWQRVLDVNAKGVALCCQYGLGGLHGSSRRLYRQQRGRSGPHSIVGRAVWPPGHPRQRDLARPDPDPAPGRTPVRSRQASIAPQPHPNGPLWQG